MDLNELMARLDAGENLHTEFKEWPITADSLAASVVAFANTDGGVLCLGVDNAGQILGIDSDELDRATQFVDNIARNNCQPPVTVLQEAIQDNQGRFVIAAHVPRGDARPYRTNRGLYYVRATSGRRLASREELLRLFQSTADLYYDQIPILRSSLTDMYNRAQDTLLESVEQQGFEIVGIPVERLLRNWRLVQDSAEDTHLTLAGVLFLSRDPQQFLPHTYISALRIPGTDISTEPMDQAHIDGPVMEMLQRTMSFLEIHLARPHQIEGLEPEVTPELPSAVIREALVNALAHRDYTIPAPMRVIVFDDRVEIHSPGQLPDTVTLESLPLGVHVLRNPTIYNIFLKIGLVTDAGSGIPRMIKLLRESTGHEPEFRLEEHELIVVLPRRSQGR